MIKNLIICIEKSAEQWVLENGADIVGEQEENWARDCIDYYFL